MPRLTSKQYLERRHLIRREWFVHDGGALAYLSSVEQRVLHAYFGTLKQLDDREAIAFRLAVTRSRPELPQAAGRAWTALLMIHQLRRRPSASVNATASKSRRQVIAHPLVQPELDIHRLARLLRDLAIEDQKNDRKPPRECDAAN